jgi:hypothetical protein
MATYKVLQDIEAEDKLVGPLTLRQCIYAAIAIFSGWLGYLCISKGAPFLAFIFLPFIGFGLFFAFPWTKQQSTEVWALAKIRFALKPRRRIWDQSGAKNLVTVTAPKVVETGPTVSDLSETEVRSRLKALAETIDSRGWAIKNVPAGLYEQPYRIVSSDRLVDVSNVPQEVPAVTPTANEDILDMANNPIAQQFEQKITAASSAHRQQLVEALNNPVPAAPAASVATPAATTDPNYWYMPAPTTFAAPAAIDSAAVSVVAVPQAAVPTAEEEALAQEIRRKQELLDSQPTHSHWRTIQPLSVQAAQQAAAAQAAAMQPAVASDQQAPNQAIVDPAQMSNQPMQPVTDTPDPDILDLANNNDLDVATIAREAQHRKSEAANEVVVKLH